MASATFAGVPLGETLPPGGRETPLGLDGKPMTHFEYLTGVEYYKFQRHQVEQKRRERTEGELQDINSPISKLLIESTIIGAVLGATAGGIRASWLDVPNEYGVRRVNRIGSLKLIFADAALFAVLGNIYTLSQTFVESQTKSDGKWTAAAGAFLTGFIGGSYTTKSFRYGISAGSTLGLGFFIAHLTGYEMVKRVTLENIWTGIVPVLALKESIRERKHLTRPPLVPPELLPFQNWGSHYDMRDEMFKEGAWDPPEEKKLVCKVSPEVWDKWFKLAPRGVTSGSPSYIPEV